MTAIKKVCKVLVVLFSIGVIGFIFIVGAFLGWPAIKSKLSQTQFNSKEWKSHLNDRNPLKINMVDDLLKSQNLIGKSRDEIIELLGKPEQVAYFNDYEFVYWLGPERSLMSIDSEWLGIKFEDNKVTQADILRD